MFVRIAESDLQELLNERASLREALTNLQNRGTQQLTQARISAYEHLLTIVNFGEPITNVVEYKAYLSVRINDAIFKLKR